LAKWQPLTTESERHGAAKLRRLGYDEAPTLREKLRRPREIQSLDLALWAFRKVRDLGQLELGWVVIQRAKEKNKHLTKDDERQILMVSDTRKMEQLLQMCGTKRGVEELTKLLRG